MGFPRARQSDQAVRLTALDRVVGWMAEQGADESHMHIGAIMRVDGPPPSLASLRDHVAGRIQHAPVLEYRLGHRRRWWEPVSGLGVDVAAHVEEMPLRPSADALAAAAAVMRRPLPPDRPLWALTLVHGYASDQYLLCYRTHHMFQDGMSVTATLETLFGNRRLARPGSRPIPRKAPGPAKAKPKHQPFDLGLPLRRCARWSPIRGPLTRHRTLRTFELDSRTLEAVAHSTGASVNQVCLAALTGALRAWTPRDWSRTAPANDRRGLAVAMPVNLRSPDRDGALGNHVAVLPVVLACEQESPQRQLESIVAQTQARRILRHRARGRALERFMSYPVARVLFTRFTDPCYLAMVVTTVRVAPGLTVLGSPVRDFLPCPPLAPGQHIVIALTQYGPKVTASLLADNVVPELDRLEACWHQALAGLQRLTPTK